MLYHKWKYQVCVTQNNLVINNYITWVTNWTYLIKPRLLAWRNSPLKHLLPVGVSMKTFNGLCIAIMTSSHGSPAPINAKYMEYGLRLLCSPCTRCTWVLLRQRYPPGELLHIWNGSWGLLSGRQRWRFFSRHFPQRALPLFWHSAQHRIRTLLHVAFT